ncbi:MAG TPA: hypothetical protein VF638_00555 [Sphingomonas sp.]|jgi:hypothetical protein
MSALSPDEILATLAAHDARNASLRAANKAALFAILAASGITHVVVEFDGSGDSGQIESIGARAGDAAIDLPDATVAMTVVEWGATEPVTHELPLPDVIEQFAYDLLGDTHGGWANNDGAYGDFIFDVAVGTISLEFHERYVATESYTHEF